MKIKVVSRARLAVFIGVLSLLLILGGWLAGARSAAYAAEASLSERVPVSGPVIVALGDTLWDIAGDYAPLHMDLRYAVYTLRQHNQLASANLMVGQRIDLPPQWTR